MSDLKIQPSFNTGEWSPKLFARVDLAKYRTGAALLENFFIDYRGGASTRPGTKYIIQCYNSTSAVRLIPFQAAFRIGYVLEFGNLYMRPLIDGAPVLETPFSIIAATKANPAVLTVVGHNYAVNQWIFVTGVGGMTQLNNRYFKIIAVVGNNISLADLNGVPINSTSYGTYTTGGFTRRVYQITTPYTSADLALLKYAQNISDLIICSPNYPPHVLRLNTATNWTIAPITFGTTAVTTGFTGALVDFPAPAVGDPAVSRYSYIVTSVDSAGQESAASVPIVLGPTYDIRTIAGTIQLNYAAAAGAVAYNIYRANISYNGPVPIGAAHGYMGTATGLSFVDSNIAPDFSQTPPIPKSPFNNANGQGVSFVTVTAPGTYTTVPGVSFTGASSAIAASASASLGVQGTPTVGVGGTGYVVGDRVGFTNGVVLVVASVAGGTVTAWEPMTNPQAGRGAVTSGSTPANPVVQTSTSGVGTGATANLVWGVNLVNVTVSGAGYVSVPTVTFSSGAAAATATLAPASDGYPTVPTFFQQRLILAAPLGAPQTFYMSQPGSYYNFNVSSPTQATDSITGSLVSGQLNTIKSMVSQPTGLLILTDRASWLVNGGGAGTAVAPDATVANAQSFNGASDVPPIIANFDILYVQSKGSIVRDSSYNIYANIFTGTDISVISSHLFTGHTVTEWAWAEEPFKVVWGVRNDGVMLLLTFLKEQEFIGWTHCLTDGDFKSVAVVTEGTATGDVDAVYTVVERNINGFVVKYIERIAEREFPNGVEDAWCVDAALQYVGVPTTTFSNAEHLAGETVTGLADGVIIPPFVMPANGQFILGTPASKVTVGIGYTCNLQTLPIDLGEPTIQGKVKKIPDVTVRVSETLGLDIGPSFTQLTPMKDLIRGNVSKMLTGLESQVVTGLVTGDANTLLPANAYTVPGQYCIRQSKPYPASVLGVIPNITVGNDK